MKESSSAAHPAFSAPGRNKASNYDAKEEPWVPE